MMEFVGIVRHRSEIDSIIKWLDSFIPQGEKDFVSLDYNKTDNEQAEIYNMLTAGRLIAAAAAERRDSIGAHCMVE